MKEFIEEFKKIKYDPSVTHKLFKNVLTPTPEMQPFLDYIEFSKTAGNYREDTEGFYVLHTDPYAHDLSQFLGILDLRKEMQEIYKDEIDIVGITLLISKYTEGEVLAPTGISKHWDPQDTIHWGCTGKSFWKIFEEVAGEEVIYEYVVEPGDIFFAKTHTFHEVKSLTQRAACILTMHKNGVTEFKDGEDGVEH